MSISLKKITGYKQNQVKYILIGSILGFTGGATNFPLWYDIPIYPYGNFAVLIFFVTFTYAIVRFRLMDIKFVFKKGMVYSLSAGLLTALFVVIVISMTNFLSNVAGIGSFSITLIAALIIAVLFNPLKNKIQLFIDRSFYKNAYNYYPTVRKISRKLTSFFDIDQLFEYIGEVIFSTLNLKSILLLKDIPYRGFESVYHKSQKTMNANINIPSTTELLNIKIQKSSELVKFFKTSDDILIKDELPAFEKIIGIDKINLIDNELTGFQGEVVVPVFIENKLTVLIILGEKLSGDMFTLEDINLLSTISDQTAIALKNVTLYKDKVNSERLASIGMMSATFAHEIRNPLTSLKTFAQLMPEKYNDEEFRNTFSKIVEGEIERIDGLIGDLLDFSTEKKASRMNIINVVSLVDETVDYVKSQLNIDKKGISVSKMYSEDEIFISGDSEKLKQTFINILMNGCQAMNGEGILTVKIRQNAKVLNVYISDTGKGIHPDHIEKIFDPFVTTKEMGVGLGLAISKRIIEDHNGKISVKSSISKGSTFKISLPVQN